MNKGHSKLITLSQLGFHDTTISHIECQLRGGWQALDSTRSLQAFQGYHATGDDCEIHLVRPDELVRRLRMKQGARIRVGSNAITFNSIDVIEELTIDEDKQQGKPSDKNTVFNTD